MLHLIWLCFLAFLALYGLIVAGTIAQLSGEREAADRAEEQRLHAAAQAGRPWWRRDLTGWRAWVARAGTLVFMLAFFALIGWKVH